MYIIIHYNEIALKKGNRDYFEKKLIKNIKERFDKDFPEKLERIKRFPGRFLLKLKKENLNKENGAENSNKKSMKEDLKKNDDVRKVLKNIFGIHNFSFAKEIDQNIESFKIGAWEAMKNDKFKTFRITTQRSNKDFSMTSEEINREVGDYIFKKLEEKGLKPKVNLKNPDKECFVEIFNNTSFVYTEKIGGVGGMPVGTGGKALALLSGGIDSPVASYYGIKRGVSIDFIHFHSLPYTNIASNEKVENLARKLLKFQLNAKIFMVPFAEIQQKIVINCPEKLRVIFYRRMMMKISEELANKRRYKVLYTGESVAQVASQTLENIVATNDAVLMPVFRPLIGFDKLEIIEIAKKIDTYNISILSHEDCCTRFVPKHPETKAKLKEVRKAEKSLDVKKIIQEALKNTETINI